MQKAILKPGIYVVLSIRQTYAMGTAQQTGRPDSIVEVCPIEGGDVKMVPLPEGVRIPPQDPVASSFTIKVGSPTDPWHVYSMRSGQEILPEPETESMLSSQ